jgi:hypothetical protein
MISVVSEELNETKGIVILQSDILGSDAWDELRAAPAMEQAISHASKKGLPDPRINGTVNVYAVDAEGKEIELGSTTPFVAFRADVPVTRKLL